jgi:hypothetical protein
MKSSTFELGLTNMKSLNLVWNCSGSNTGSKRDWRQEKGRDWNFREKRLEKIELSLPLFSNLTATKHIQHAVSVQKFPTQIKR